MSVENGVVYLMDPPSGMVRDVNQRAEYEPLAQVSAIFFPLSTIAMAVRMYTRVAIVHKLSLDDYLMMLAWLRLTSIPTSLNNLLAAIFFCAATGLAKGSILLFYLRIFPMKKAQILVWIAFVFIVGYSTASVLVNIFSCHPVQGSWDLDYVPTAKCINRPVFYFLQSGLGIFADIMTVVIPIPWLKTLMSPKRQKIGVGILLTMGASVCVVSVVRLHSLNVLLHDLDLTSNTVLALMWCVLELNLSIIGGSVATIKPFLRIFMPRVF
ncbi:hypothetical protein FGRMN_702 [Fusarium graminum]|nr:hypothetical protein FGRMN_702 [Fusarium graminum]